MKRPATSILNPAFKYVPAKDTNIKKTFARIRREQEKSEAEKQKATVTPIKKERRKA